MVKFNLIVEVFEIDEVVEVELVELGLDREEFEFLVLEVVVVEKFDEVELIGILFEVVKVGIGEFDIVMLGGVEFDKGEIDVVKFEEIEIGGVEFDVVEGSVVVEFEIGKLIVVLYVVVGFFVDVKGDDFYKLR